MGNISQRMGGKASARVIQPDGIMVEYDYCIQVAMLMTLHPGHLVIHWSDETVSPGERRRHVEVMDQEARLSLGKSYILYPIPPEYKEMATTGAPVQTLGPSSSNSRVFFFDLKFTLVTWLKRSAVKGTRRRRFWRMKVLKFPSRLAFRPRSPRPAKVKDVGWVPLLDLDTVDQNFV